MIKPFVLALTVLSFSQICLASPADDAEEALDNLRQVIIKNLNAAYDEQIKIANDFDTIALDARSKDKEDCVAEEASNTVYQLELRNYDLIDMSLMNLYDVQKQVITCGRTDENCLKEVMITIDQIVESLPEIVKESLDNTRTYVQEQVELINACITKKLV